jgi:ankyrin repeat protein
MLDPVGATPDVKPSLIRPLTGQSIPGNNAPGYNASRGNHVAGSRSSEEVTLERRKLAKACSLVARLTRDELLLPDEDQDTLLHMVIAKSESYMTEALLHRLDRDGLTESIINLKNKQGQTPLCLATITNQWKVVQMLVERRADVNVRIPLGGVGGGGDGTEARLNTRYCNPVHFAASNGLAWLQTLKELLRSANVDLRAVDSEGCSALHKAVMTHGLQVTSGQACELIDSRSSITQLFNAVSNLDINQQDGVNQKTAWQTAFEKMNLELIEHLLQLIGSLPHAGDVVSHRIGPNEDTMLHVAAGLQVNDPTLVRLLKLIIGMGADSTTLNRNNLRPWQVASSCQVIM